MARRVAEVRRRGARPIALDANAQMQRERRLRQGAGWDEATRFAAMMTRIRVDGGVTDHVAMGLSQRLSDVITVRTASVGGIVMVPAGDAERGPSAEVHCRRNDSRWGALNPPPSAFDLGSFSTPFRAPGPPVLCRMECGRAGFSQRPGAGICCMDCYHGRGHSRICDARNGIHPDPEPDPDLDPDQDPEPDYETDEPPEPEPDYGMDSDDSDVDIDALAVGGPGGARSEERTRGRVLMRADYVAFTEYFHGEGAIGTMSIMDNATAPGLTFMGGFDVIQDAHDVVTERHGFPPHLCDATAFYADPSALFVVDEAGQERRAKAAHLRRISGVARSRTPTTRAMRTMQSKCT